MKNNEENGSEYLSIPAEIVAKRIFVLRCEKVMIDRDLAELYGVTTKRLNQQVKRNLSRFPSNFMFQLCDKEKAEVVTICDHLNTKNRISSRPVMN
ncbi:MAG: ORF6N domain-containing protein [Candidatus Omnitrophica bacterium]|nr:ORF6N domain-containing protein [Candidatus Omnitrophota bacterium]